MTSPKRKHKASRNLTPITRPPNKVLPPTTTAEENDVTAGQRRVNLWWEVTQSVIAVSITAGTIWCQVHKIDSPEINYAFFLIVSMYYVRTNHTLTGGVSKGSKSR